MLIDDISTLDQLSRLLADNEVYVYCGTIPFLVKRIDFKYIVSETLKEVASLKINYDYSRDGVVHIFSIESNL